MTIFYIVGGVCLVLLIGPIGILLEKPLHWLMRQRGVTELTNKQRRYMAKRYTETTGRRFLKKRKRKARRTL